MSIVQRQTQYMINQDACGMNESQSPELNKLIITSLRKYKPFCQPLLGEIIPFLFPI